MNMALQFEFEYDIINDKINNNARPFRVLTS